MFDRRACAHSSLFVFWLSSVGIALGCSPKLEEPTVTSADAGENEPEPEPEPEPATPAQAVSCAGRGEPLDGLSVGGGSGLRAEVLSIQPDPAVVGDNTWTIRLTLGDEPLVGAASDIRVSPFMPDHGHGSPVTVVVAELGDGEYELSPVNLFMPGYWEVGLEVAGDSGEASLSLDVCIE